MDKIEEAIKKGRVSPEIIQIIKNFNVEDITIESIISSYVDLKHAIFSHMGITLKEFQQWKDTQ